MTLVRKLALGVLSVATTASAAMAQTGAATPTTYRGPLSFGGTVAITVDAPSAGKVQVRFDDSPLGLQGTIVGSYTVRHGEYTVRKFSADTAEPPPEALATRLRGVGLRFTRQDERLSGGISGLPNPAVTARNARLAGVVHASAATTLPALASIAGVYTYVRQQSAPAPSVSQSMTAAEPQPAKPGIDSGQFRVDRAGTMWPCQGADCLSPGNGAPVHKLEPADQTRWPGAFAITTDGKPGGRLYVAGQPGDHILYVAHRDDSGGGIGGGIGSAVMRTAAQVPSVVPSGRWRCQHPTTRVDAQTGIHAYRGTLQTETLEMSGPSVRNRNLQRPVVWRLDPSRGAMGRESARNPERQSVPEGTAPEAQGLYWVSWTPQRHQAFLPLDANTMTYLLQSTVPASPLDQMGVCHRQQVAATRARRTNAKTGRKAGMKADMKTAISAAATGTKWASRQTPAQGKTQ
ncbi:hypothetical protein [Cupriavidus plantarum]|uniref:hypothetical protein n=1 Tax=Cupriavidus plantarum TaxID=942865 RepID=UPI000EAFDF75|nr:hypothetical protein [Cupriavidus plantarum]RLK44849.1 hypothetical protein C7417_0848 [Cupriavidus plantarum]